MAARSPPLFPERIGRYDVLLPIASGGMGTVYLARATSIGGFEREIALKLMHAHLKENTAFASELVEEAKLTVRIRHPNVVSVIDVGEDPFGVFLVMDYIEGDTLAGLQRRTATIEGKLPLRFGLKLLMDALAGLHAAHELRDATGAPASVVHRDFSPQNILVGVDGVGRLTDFGIAKAATRISETSTGIIKGKIAYMSPEQTRGAKVDRRADVWAAGVVAWQIIAGRKLHPAGDNDVATLLKIATEAPPRLRDLKPDVPEAFDQAVAKALAMNVEDRWPSVQAFKQALQAACVAYGETAETEEVAAFVSRIVEPVLVERRARAAEILELRAKMEKLAGTPETSRQTTPYELHADDAPTLALASHAPVAHPPLETTVSVATTSVVETASTRRQRALRSPIMLVATGLGLSVAVASLVLFMNARREPATAPASSLVFSIAASSPLPAQSAATPVTSTVAIAPSAVTARPAPPAPPRTAVTTHAAKPVAPASTSILPRSPYEEHR